MPVYQQLTKLWRGQARDQERNSRPEVLKMMVCAARYADRTEGETSTVGRGPVSNRAGYRRLYRNFRKWTSTQRTLVGPRAPLSARTTGWETQRLAVSRAYRSSKRS